MIVRFAEIKIRLKRRITVANKKTVTNLIKGIFTMKISNTS